MIIQPYSNLTLDLASTIMIGFFPLPQREEGQTAYHKLMLNGQTADVHFQQEKVQEVYDAIQKFNAGKGNYHGLFSNIYINLDKVSMVSCIDNKIQVYHDAGCWVSGTHDNAKDIYNAYAKAMRARQKVRDEAAKLKLPPAPPRLKMPALVPKKSHKPLSP